MGRNVAQKFVQSGTTQIVFTCPGCGHDHAVTVEAAAGPVWEWNGSLEAPKFKPSLLAEGRQWDSKAEKLYDLRCHSFVTDGEIRFLTDCNHDRAGQTMKIKPVK